MADLTTLAAVKAYLAVTTTNQDALIASLIPRESRLVEQWTSRKFPSVTNTEKRLNGTGSAVLVLPDSPILSVALVQIGLTVIPASPDGMQYGYTFDDNALYLVGGVFQAGRQNVVCTWTAGYEESETDYVPAAAPYTITPTNGGAAATDSGVVYASSGAALTPVGNGPVVGQYTFANGTYTFNAGDANASVTMTYGYVPGPVAQACIEMIGLDMKQRDNLGINSKTLAGETVTYSDKGMSASVREMLQPYRRMVPA